MREDVAVIDKPIAVLFDMDGTLLESHANVDRAWATWARDRGLDVDAVLADAHGLPAETTAARWLPGASDGEIAAAADAQLALQYDDVDGITIIEGVAELLAFLDESAIPWAVHTSADDRLARVRLGAVGIDPPVLVTRDQLQQGKPSPEGYLRAAQILGVPAEACIVVEDTSVGIESGRRAGMLTVGVRGAEGDLPLRTIPDLHLWLTITTRKDDAEPPQFPFMWG